MKEENRYDKIKRIVESKLVDRIDKDYTELSEEAFGKAYSSDVARRMFYGAKKVIDAIEEDGEREFDKSIMFINDVHLPFERDDVLDLIKKHSKEQNTKYDNNINLQMKRKNNNV